MNISTHKKTLVMVVGVMVGIAVGEISMYGSEVAVGVLLLSIVQSGLYIYERRMERKRKQTSDAEGVTRLFSFSLVTLLFSLGLCVGIVRQQLVEEKIKYACEYTCSFEAVVVSSSETKDEYQIFSVRPIHDDDRKMYDIEIRSALYPRHEIGETLMVSGKVSVPKVIMSHDASKNNRAFDYTSYLRTKNIGSEMFYPHIEVIDTEAHEVLHILGRWKDKLIMRIDRYVSAPESSIASGMLFGSSTISRELLQTFRTTGVSHIVVLSGFNLVIVIVSILFVFTFLPLVLRIVLAFAFVTIFVMMVGGSPSIVRAMLMAFISLLAMLVGRSYVARQALIVSLFLIVMYEPYSLMYDVSLHLSFLATAGLVYMSEPFHLFLKSYSDSVRSPLSGELFITTLSAYFATLPYIMYTFGTVSVYALVVNMIVVPMVPLAMLLSFLVIMSSYVSFTVATLFGFLSTSVVAFMIWTVRWFEELPFASISITFSFIQMFAVYLCIIIGMSFFSKRLEKKMLKGSLMKENETHRTNNGENLTDIISY